MPSIMNTSFVAFLSLSVAALSSFYLQIAFSSNISAFHLNIYTKFPIISTNISIETIPSLDNILTNMGDTVDAARILLQKKRARERDTKVLKLRARQKKKDKRKRQSNKKKGRGEEDRKIKKKKIVKDD